MKTYEFGPGCEIRIVAHSSLHTTRAKTTRVGGEFTADLASGAPTGDVTGWAEVEAKSFKSGNRLLEMNTLRHIGARNHPTARFEISSVEVLALGPPATVRVAGTMEFHGVTQKIRAEPTVVVEGTTVTVEGHWVLRQSDFGLRPPRLAMLKVDDEIDVEFRLVAE